MDQYAGIDVSLQLSSVCIVIGFTKSSSTATASELRATAIVCA